MKLRSPETSAKMKEDPLQTCEVTAADIAATIVAKSDQLNADDLVAGPITARVIGLKRGTADQPVLVVLDNAKQPWKPCKTARRVLVFGWGGDPTKWIGRSLKLYRDDSVLWGGKAVGGIRVAAMSHIPKAFTLSLAVAKGKKSDCTIDVLDAPEPGRAFVTPIGRRPIAERQTRAQAALVADGLLEAAIAEHGDITGWGHDDVDRVIAWRSEQLRIRAEAKAAAEAAMREPGGDDDGGAA